MNTNKTFTNTMPWTNTQVRNNPFPLEVYSIFDSLSAAETYALSNVVSYEGQIVAVKDNGIQKVYVLDSTMSNGLRQLAAGDDASHVQELLNAEISNRISVDNLLSGAISSEIEDRISDVSALSDALTAEVDARTAADELLSTSLSIGLSSVDGTGGILKTYTITQGTKTVGSIDIPKDFLVKKAELCTVTEDGKPYDGAKVGDKYIDFTINTPGDDEAAKHVYLPVKDLVDVYTGATTDTVTVTIGDDNSISAVVRDGSILAAHLANGAVTSDKILSSAVTTEKIADSAVTEAKLNDGAVTTSKIADGNITLAKLSSDVTDYIGEVSADAKGYTDTAICGLTASFTGSTSKTITAMSQADGVVSLTATDIEIAASQVSDFNDAVNGIVGSYVPLSAAETASGSNKLQTKQNVDNAISAAIDALDYTEQTVPAGQTISAISETNGVIAVRTGTISINTNQITDIDSKLADYVKTKVVDGTPTVDDKIQTKSKVTAAINTAISGLDVDSIAVGANKTIASIGETDGKISVVTADIEIAASQVSDFNTAVNGIVGNYVPLSVASKSASDSNTLQAASEVSAIAEAYASSYATSAVNGLDVDSISVGAGKTLVSLGEVDGKISAQTTVIAITTSQVTDFDEKVKAIAGGYVPLSVAEKATDSNKLQTASGVSAIAEAYASDYATSAVNGLDVNSIPVGADKTLVSLGEVDGKISAEAVAIQITKSQVTDLTSDLTSITADVAKNAGDISSLQNTKLDKSEFSTLSNEIGLSAASASNQVVTKNDIADLAGAMHFRGPVTPTEDQSDLDALAAQITDPKSGDVAIITTNSKEYVYNGSKWIELGAEDLYATKAEVGIISGQLTADIVKLTANDQYLSGQISTITSTYATKTELTGSAHSLSTDYNSKINGLSGTYATKTEVNDVSSVLSNAITVITSDYATEEYVNGISSALSTDYVGKIKAVDDKLAGYALSADVTAGIAAAKSEVVGQASDLSSADTIHGAKAYADGAVAALSIDDYIKHGEVVDTDLSGFFILSCGSASLRDGEPTTPIA